MSHHCKNAKTNKTVQNKLVQIKLESITRSKTTCNIRNINEIVRLLLGY